MTKKKLILKIIYRKNPLKFQMNVNTKKIYLVLPNKIGDSILAIPFLICLKQLIQKYKKNYSVTVFCSNGLEPVFKSMDIFPVKKLSWAEKVKSWVSAYDEAVFLDTSSRNMFLKAKHSLGMNNKAKKYINYNQDLPFLDPRISREPIPIDLHEHLSNKMNLSITSSAYVSIALYLGFNKEQIIETFKFSQNDLTIKNMQKLSIDSEYIVCCMEAACGSNSAKQRLWKKENYLKIAGYLYEKYNYKTIFIGIDSKDPIPEDQHLIDLRNKYSLSGLTKLMASSAAYIGNDTGPLHIANLVKIPSIGIHILEETIKGYSPIFPELNSALLNPDVKSVTSQIDCLMNSLQKI